MTLLDVRALRALVVALLLTLAASCSSGGFLTELYPDGGGPDAGGASEAATASDGTTSKRDASVDARHDARDATSVRHDTGVTPPSCTDGVKDGHETGVDCGGPVCAACSAGQGCGKDTDCTSLFCTGGICQASSPTDGIRNDSETDVDCGGARLADGTPNPDSDGAPACAVGRTCLLPTDCIEGVCSAASVASGDAGPAADGGDAGVGDAGEATGKLYCQPASPTDGVTNDSETDVDCGGARLADGMANPASDHAPVCASGQMCLLGTDCQTGVCNANGGAGGGPIDCPATTGCTCQPPSATDGVKNDSETDVDCGGETALGSDGAPPCAPGSHCLVGSDCQSQICDPTGLCTTPTPTDGFKNDSETDVDCGGARLADGTANPASDGAPRCVDDQGCLVDPDCLSGYCSLVSHTCIDGQSCKGLATPAAILDIVGCYNAADPTTPLACPVGSTCNTASYDCVDGDGDVVGAPDPNGQGQSAGLDTCGAGEATDPIATQHHESCCRSLLLPDSSARLDKYEITAGRMRQFLESLHYDVAGWASTQIAAGTAAGKTLSAQIPASLIALLPTSADPTVPMNAVVQLGGTTIDAQSQEQGCYVGAGAYGASVYYWDAPTLVGVGSPPRSFTQDYYDIKSQNCALYQMYAAFCAWDGGQLATIAQEQSAYGTATFPWGATPRPSPYPYAALGGQVNPWCGGTVAPTLPNVSMINSLVMSSGQPSTSLTVNWLNSNNTGNAGCFYYYPSYPESNPSQSIADTISNGLDLSPQIAAPGRFVLDVTAATSPSFGTHEGWYDLGANQLELDQVPSLTGTATLCDCTGVTGPGDGALPACTCCAPPTCTFTKTGVLRASNLPYGYLEGGSWEGHSGFNPASLTTGFWSPGGNDGAGWPVSGQYGKIGARCARPVEPSE